MATGKEEQPIWVQDLLAWLDKIEAKKLEGEKWIERVNEVLAELLPDLSEPLKQDDLRDTKNVCEEYSRSQTIADVTAQTSASDVERLKQSLADAQSIYDEYSRWQAIADVVAQIPESEPELLKQALDVAQRISDEYCRSEAIAAVASQIPASEPELLKQALEAIQRIDNGNYRSPAIVSLATQIPSSELELLKQALEAAQSIDNEYYRSPAIVAVATQIPASEPELLKQALEAAQSIDNEYYRSPAIVAVATQIPESEPELLKQSLEAAQRIKNDECRWKTIAIAAAQLPSLERKLVLQQAIESTQRIYDEYSKSKAIADVATQIPASEPELLENALKAAQSIESEHYRSKAIAAVAAQIPALERKSALQQAIEVAQRIENEDYRSQAIAAVAAQIPSSEPELLKQVLENAQRIEYEDYRSQAIAAVAAQIPSSEPELLKQVLENAQRIVGEEYRLPVIVAVATQIPASEPELIKQALEAAQLIENEYLRSPAITAIAAQIPAFELELIKQALETAQTINDEYCRAPAIAAVAAQIPISKRKLTLQQTIKVAQHIENEDYRSQAIATVVAQIPTSEPELLKQTLETAQSIGDENCRLSVIAAIAAQIPASEPELLKQALKAAQSIIDVQYRWQAIAAVAAKIPESEPELLKQALEAAQSLFGEEYKSPAIAAVVAQIPVSEPELLKQALEAAQNIEDKQYKAPAIAAVASQLSPSERKSVLQQAIKVAQSIEDYYSDSKGRAIAAVAAQIPVFEPDLLKQALETAQSISDEYFRSKTITAVAAQIPESELELLKQALEAAQSIQNNDEYRSKTITAVAAQILPSQRKLALQQAIGATKSISDEYSRSKAIAAVVAQIPVSEPELLLQAFEAAQNIGNENYRSEAIATVATQLPPSERKSALQKALEVAQNIEREDYRSQTIAVVAARIPASEPELLKQAFEAAQSLVDEQNRSPAIATVAAQIPVSELDLLKQALEATQNINRGYHRSEAIAAVVAKLPTSEYHKIIEICSKLENKQYRIEALGAIAFKATEMLIAQTPQNLISTILEIVPNGKNSADKAKLLSALATRLSTGLFPRALQIIQNEINHPTYQAETLSNLLPYLPPEQLPEALAVITSFAGYSAPTTALCQLIPKLTFPDLELVFKDFIIGTTETKARIPQPKLQYQILKCLNTCLKSILENITEIDADQHSQERLSQEINDHLHQIINEYGHLFSKLSSDNQTVTPKLIAEQTKILRTIRENSRDFDKANALIQITASLDDSLSIEAQSIAQEIQDAYHKARALVSLASRFPKIRNEAQQQVNQTRKDEIQHIELLSQFATIVPEQIPNLLKSVEEWSGANPFELQETTTDPERCKYKRRRILIALKPHLPIRLSREIDRETSIGKAPQDLWERCLFVLRNEYRQALKSGSFRNDATQDEDLLNLKDEINALTEMLLMRDLTPPVAVGILGGWGGGKSYMMHLMQKHMVEIRSRGLDPVEAWGFKDKDEENPDSSRLNRYVGHIYQIKFDAWTYAKSNLWASLMQTIFFELDRQISLEHQIDTALKRANPKTTPLDSQNGTIWQALYEVSDEDREWFLKNVLTDQTFNEWEKLSKENSSSEKLWELFGNSQKEAIADLEALKSTLQETKENLQKKPVEILNDHVKRKAFFDTASQKAIAILQKRLGKNFTDEIKKDLEQKLTKIQDTTTDLNQFYDLVKDDIETVLEKKETQIDIQFIKEFTVKNYLFILICLSFILLAIFIPIALPESIKNNLVAQIISATTPLVAAIPFAKTTIQRGRKLYNQIKLEVSDFTHKLENNIQNQIDTDKDLLALKTKITELEKEVKNKSADIPTNTYASITDFVKDRVQKGGYQEHLGMMHQVKEDLSMLSKRLLPPPADSKEYATKVKQLAEVFPRGSARVVLYIDDLDRCPPKTVVEVLEAVQLLVKNPLFIAVLAIDERYITRALADHYKGVLPLKGRPSASDYLEKIIQIPYRIRPISEQALRQYLRAQIVVQDSETSGTKFNEFSPEEFNLLVTCCQESELSPRSLKRLTNVYKLYKVLSRTRGQKPTPKEQKTILTLLAFSSRYPDLMRDILQKIGSIFDQSQNPDNEKETLFNVFKTYLENPAKNSANSYLTEDVKQLTYDFHKLVDEKLELNEIRSIFDFVRTFSFVGDIGVDHTNLGIA